RLAVTPAQYLATSTSPTLLATQRQFSSMAFRLFYLGNSGFTPTQLVSGTPGITHVSAVPSGSMIGVSTTITGDFIPSIPNDTGVHTTQVWIVAAKVGGNMWTAFDLAQGADPSQWSANISMTQLSTQLGITDATQLRFMVVAANDAGLVAHATNGGAFFAAFTPSTTAAAPKRSTKVDLVSPPSSGTY